MLNWSVDRKYIKLMNRDAQLAVAATSLALEDSRLNREETDPSEIGVAFGAFGIQYTFEEAYVFLEELEGDTDEIMWKFRRIIAHQGPFKQQDKEFKGSRYNVMIEWEDGSRTYEPLGIIAKDDPVTCAAYAKDNDLLDTEGWRQFRSLAQRDK